MNEPARNPETRIALFQGREIRRTIHDHDWWFVITDVVVALTDSVDASGYLKKMRNKAEPLLGSGQ
jgi:prophage antirepressor-like protein